MRKKKITILILSIVLIIIDQVSKILVVNNLSVGESKNIIDGFFSLTYVKNTGAAWGMFSNGTLILGLLSMVFSIILIKHVIESKKLSTLSVISYSLLLSGIIGNMLDRFIRGFVIDFLNFFIFSYDYPVFNIADVFIVVGIILIIIETFIEGDKNDSK